LEVLGFIARQLGMEVATAVTDDETLESSGSRSRGERVWPWLCAFVLVAAGIGGRAAWNVGERRMGTNEVIGRQEHACTWDGQDCRNSRCCAKAGSKCYAKNSHWASCNETCYYNKKWDGSRRHGYWKVTNYQVWDCTDLTIAPQTTPSRSTPISSQQFKLLGDGLCRTASGARGTFTETRENTLAECQNVCSAHANCVGVEFDNSQVPPCELHSESPAQVAPSLSASCYVKVPATTQPSPAPISPAPISPAPSSPAPISPAPVDTQAPIFWLDDASASATTVSPSRRRGGGQATIVWLP